MPTIAFYFINPLDNGIWQQLARVIGGIGGGKNQMSIIKNVSLVSEYCTVQEVPDDNTTF